MDIYDDSMWLINLVENLLAVTRIEEGRMNLHITEDLMEDVIKEALHHINVLRSLSKDMALFAFPNIFYWILIWLTFELIRF